MAKLTKNSKVAAADAKPAAVTPMTPGEDGEGKAPAAGAPAAGVEPIDAAGDQTLSDGDGGTADAAAAQAAAAAVPEGHTHRCNWTVWHDRREYREGATIALTDELAEQLGDAVTKL